MRELELLAPAKDLLCGMAAIDCGADAVYIGAEKFGARQAVGNSIDDISSLCRYAHQFGCKVYVTVNTIIYDKELDATQQLLNKLADIGVDAILIQDMGITKLSLPTNIALHASTQTDNRTEEKVSWLSSKGFQRVVLARELSLEEIERIHKSSPDTELEVFVHGALCVSYSGICYASQNCFGRSANRGECAQFCRMKFDLIDRDGNIIIPEVHLLSLKDMCRIEKLEQLADAGVTSFKIEGRLKDINYVRNVTKAYSERLDTIIKKRQADYRRASVGKCRLKFTPNLRKTFNRGFTEYFLKGRTGELASFYTPKAMGEYVGKVKEIRGTSFNVAGTATFANGDGLCFINSNKELEGFRINRAEGNRLFPQKMPRNLKPGMALYRNSDQQFEKQLSSDKDQRKISVDIKFYASKKMLTLIASPEGCKGNVAIKKETELEIAKTNQEENIRKQLSRLGNSMFTAESITVIQEDKHWFIPNSDLTNIRREMVGKLEEEIPSMLQKGKDRTAMQGHNHEHTEKEMPNYPYSYMYNISNHLSKQFYIEEGIENPSPAYEISKYPSALIMQCKYCLRYEMGICKRSHNEHKINEPLRLRLSDGRTFRLDFDCKNCQMNIYSDE